MSRAPIPFDPIRRAAELWRERWGARSRAREMATATSVMRVQQTLLGRFDEIASVHGLTFARYEALVLLAFSSRGELPMRTIGERLMVHPTSATSIVQRLDGQGFVTRRPNPDDGRGTLAAITPAGRAAMEATTRDLVAARFGLAALSAGEQDQLFALLRKLRRAQGDFVDGPAPTPRI